MQAVLWLVLASTLALAGLVTHRRTAPLRAELSDPVTFGELTVRPPRGWEREAEAAVADASRVLVFQEPDELGRGRRLLRTLWVTQDRPARKRSPEYYLETTFLSTTSDSEARAEPFNFLGARGALFVWRGVPRAPSYDEETLERAPEQGIYACAVLPDGLAVTVQVRGYGAVGPSSRKLLQQVADGMRRPESTTRPEPQTRPTTSTSSKTAE